MAIREVLKFPDPRLREISKPILEINDEIRELARDLCDAMYDEPGIGLAAPQVGVPLRLIVVDTTWTEEDAERRPLILINPELSEHEGAIIWKEGCLSVPDFESEVERSEKVRLIAQDLEGEEVTIDAKELQAVCFQHEADHLDGVLFIDRISRLKRNLYVKRRKKQLKQELEEA
ncbi:MAG: peptide deformylase [Deltaproteobacteria bacterium]|nr:peptide deformylase [Deltaproteobacteria bacterium]MBW2667610.1 peptide deformylase [Deltaproteobacteria bacterium]